jgi:hypothetical protein
LHEVFLGEVLEEIVSPFAEPPVVLEDVRHVVPGEEAEESELRSFGKRIALQYLEVLVRSVEAASQIEDGTP